MLALISGVVDLGMVLGQYMQLAEAVHQGASVAARLEQLQVDEVQGLAGNGCDVTAGTSGASHQFHQQVQNRVEQLINLQSVRLVDNTLCITTGRVADSDSVFVRVESNYDAFLPFFDGIPISVEANAPHI